MRRGRCQLSPTLGLVRSGVHVLLAFSLAGSPIAAQSPSAQEIMDRARDRFRAKIERVEGYTVIQRMLGGQDTIRWRSAGLGNDLGLQVEKRPGEEPDGRQIVKGVLAAMSMPLMVLIPFHHPSVPDRMAVRGTEELDGVPTWVLSISRVPLSWQMFGLSGDVEGRIWIGMEDDLVHRLELGRPGTAGSPGRPGVGIEYTDFREVDVLAYPFHMELSAPGLDRRVAADRRLEEALEALERARAQLPELSEAERAEAEPQIASMELMAEALNLARELRADPPTVVQTLEFRINRQ